MKTLLKTLLIAAAFGGAALAQVSQPMYVGGSFGVVSVAGIGVGFPVTAQFGVENVGMDGLDIRTSASFYITGSGIEVGVDGIYNFPIQPGLTGYAGAGPRVLFGGGAVGFGIGALGGVEYEVAPSVGLFAEAITNIYFAGPLGVFLPGLKVGANYHLP